MQKFESGLRRKPQKIGAASGCWAADPETTERDGTLSWQALHQKGTQIEADTLWLRRNRCALEDRRRRICHTGAKGPSEAVTRMWRPSRPAAGRTRTHSTGGTTTVSRFTHAARLLDAYRPAPAEPEPRPNTRKPQSAPKLSGIQTNPSPTPKPLFRGGIYVAIPTSARAGWTKFFGTTEELAAQRARSQGEMHE